jgi:hypothetical protein
MPDLGVAMGSVQAAGRAGHAIELARFEPGVRHHYQVDIALPFAEVTESKPADGVHGGDLARGNVVQGRQITVRRRRRHTSHHDAIIPQDDSIDPVGR